MKKDTLSVVLIAIIEIISSVIIGWILEVDKTVSIISLLINVLIICSFVLIYRYRYRLKLELLTLLGENANAKCIKNLLDMKKVLDDNNIKDDFNKLNGELKLLKQLNDIGIVGCTDKLEGTLFQPKKSMKRVKRNLSFMGVTGSKWILQLDVRSELERKLKQISINDKGKVRFLLIDPRSDSFQRMKAMREGALTDDSYKYWAELQNKYSDCLEIRLYDHIPSFRLQFLDDEILTVSRYRLDRSSFENSQYGWNAPHLIVSNTTYDDDETHHYWSLYEAFQLLYDHIWDDSKKL